MQGLVLGLIFLLVGFYMIFLGRKTKNKVLTIGSIIPIGAAVWFVIQGI